MGGEPFIGEIRMFGGNFAPAGWMLCQGQVLPISENDTLFNLIGTTYGGDGQSTFALPNLQSRMPVHQGTGPGLTTWQMGMMMGTETETLTTSTIPSHTHPMLASTDIPTQSQPTNSVTGQAATKIYRVPSAGALGTLAATSVAPAGGSQPHENVQPVLAINYIISLFGVYPSQN